jgi:hypothetical protein
MAGVDAGLVIGVNAGDKIRDIKFALDRYTPQAAELL